MEKKEYGFEFKGVRSPTGTYIKIIVDKTTGVNYLFFGVGAHTCNLFDKDSPFLRPY